MLHHEGIIQQEPEQVVNERNIVEQPVRQNVVKQSSKRSYDSTYKPYSRTYTNYRTEPVVTRSTTRVKATQKQLDTIAEKEEDEEIRNDPITSTPIKKIIKTSSPIKMNKEVAFKARDTILPYSPITAPNTWRETGTIPKNRESYTNIKKLEKQPVIKQLSVKDLYIPPYRKKHSQIDVSFRLDNQGISNARKNIYSDRSVDALLDQDVHSRRHNLSLTPSYKTAKTEVKKDRFKIGRAH